jgi:hypothetical protein
MLKDSLLLIVSLLFLISMLAMLSDKLRISYPIFLVLAGLGISLIPGVPQIRLDPNIVFVIFLPLYCTVPPGIRPGMISGECADPSVCWVLALFC